MSGALYDSASAQSLEGSSAVLIHEAEGTSKSWIEQAERMLAAGQPVDALDNLQRAEDISSNRLMAYPSKVLNESFGVMRYLPVSQVVSDIRVRLGSQAPAAQQLYRLGLDATYPAAMAAAQRTGRWQELEKLAGRFAASSYGDQVYLALGDACLEQGLVEPARWAFDRISSGMRAPIGMPNEMARSSLPWQFVFRKLAINEPLPREMVDYIRRPPFTAWGAIENSQLDLASIWARKVWCSILDNDLERARWEHKVLSECFPKALMSQEANAETWVARTGRWIETASHSPEANGAGEPAEKVATFAGNLQRTARCRIGAIDASIAAWEIRLPQYSGSADANPAGKPRVGELENELLVHYPVVYGNRVFVNTLTKILAFDLNHGQSWPVSDMAVPLFDSGLPEETFMPIGYPVVGVPRGTLTIADQCLYARMGSPLTGRKASGDARDESGSYLIGLDLQTQGKMLPGFPLRLQGENWKGFEFEGSPLVVGDDLFVGVTQRNTVHVRRYVACFDAHSGQLKWRSDLIAASLPDGVEQASLISHQLLSYSEGRVFYNTGLGVVAALRARDGNFCWLVRYPQVDVKQEAYTKTQRFRFRDLTPPLVHRGLVICAPPDCREIFALDWGSGDLVWASDPEMASDTIHLLGCVDDQLVMSGDRLYWLDFYTGRVLAQYPENGSELPGHALPQPRGLGRGALADDRLFWPIAGEILLFQRAAVREPDGRYHAQLEDRWKLGLKGAAGINVTGQAGWMILTSSGRLMAFAPKRDAGTSN